MLGPPGWSASRRASASADSLPATLPTSELRRTVGDGSLPPNPPRSPDPRSPARVSRRAASPLRVKAWRETEAGQTIQAFSARRVPSSHPHRRSWCAPPPAAQCTSWPGWQQGTGRVLVFLCSKAIGFRLAAAAGLGIGIVGYYLLWELGARLLVGSAGGRSGE